MKENKLAQISIAILISVIIILLSVVVVLSCLARNEQTQIENDKMAVCLAMNTHRIVHNDFALLDYTLEKPQKNLWVVEIQAVNHESYYNKFLYHCSYNNLNYMYCEEAV